MSSASWSSLVRVGMFMVFSARSSSGTCPVNSTGVSPRVPLYSGYSRVRNEKREMSNATPTCVGFSFCRRLMSIAMKPCTAFVCCPSRFWKLSAGRA